MPVTASFHMCLPHNNHDTNDRSDESTKTNRYVVTIIKIPSVLFPPCFVHFFIL